MIVHPKDFVPQAIVLLRRLFFNPIAHVYEFVIVLARVILQYIESALLHARVPVNHVKSKFLIILFAFTVDVPAPELASKNTSMSPVGKLAPLAHPEVADQLVVLFQLPVHPVIQYLLGVVGWSDHPSLFETNVLFTHAVQVAHHHTLESLRER